MRLRLFKIANGSLKKRQLTLGHLPKRAARRGFLPHLVKAIKARVGADGIQQAGHIARNCSTHTR